MAIDDPTPDVSRAIQHDPDRIWPTAVTLQLTWVVDGRNRMRTQIISADQFFGRGEFGAPLSGDSLISAIDRMRREGPPLPIPAIGPPRNAKNTKR